MKQNLSQYHIFYVTAECGSTSKAAQKLFISQPAVSKAIQKLEQSLNTVLFRREARGVTLTEEGTLLYSHVKEAFRSLSTAEQTLARQARPGNLPSSPGCQRYPLQIRAASLSPEIYPSLSPRQNHDLLSVYIPDAGTIAGKEDWTSDWWGARRRGRDMNFSLSSPSRTSLYPQKLTSPICLSAKTMGICFTPPHL